MGTGEDCVMKSFITALRTEYYSTDQIKNNEMGRGMWHAGEEETCMQEFVGEPEGKRLLERPRRRWEDNIKMDL